MLPNLKDEDGQGMVEYALVIALIALVVIAALTALGTTISARFEEYATMFDQNSSNWLYEFVKISESGWTFQLNAQPFHKYKFRFLNFFTSVYAMYGFHLISEKLKGS